MDKTKTIGAKLGALTAQVFAVCVTACLCAIMIAIAVRFIMWIF